jgi:hypothetical protein
MLEALLLLGVIVGLMLAGRWAKDPNDTDDDREW